MEPMGKPNQGLEVVTQGIARDLASSGFMGEGSGFQGSWIRVYGFGFGFRVHGKGFRVDGFLGFVGPFHYLTGLWAGFCNLNPQTLKLLNFLTGLGFRVFCRFSGGFRRS